MATDAGKIDVGSIIADNDPRMRNRQLRVVGFEPGPMKPWGQSVKAICEPHFGAAGRVKVSLYRIYTDGKLRRSGFSLVISPPRSAGE